MHSVLKRKHTTALAASSSSKRFNAHCRWNQQHACCRLHPSRMSTSLLLSERVAHSVPKRFPRRECGQKPCFFAIYGVFRLVLAAGPREGWGDSLHPHWGESPQRQGRSQWGGANRTTCTGAIRTTCQGRAAGERSDRFTGRAWRVCRACKLPIGWGSHARSNRIEVAGAPLMSPHFVKAWRACLRGGVGSWRMLG